MCNKPINVKNRRGQIVSAPCGCCAECMNKFREQWFIRLKMERRAYMYAYFVTFTYSDENLPWAEKPSLYKRDIQLLLKRVRKHNESVKFKYYCVGEYGTKFKRPHYHMIVLANDEIDIGKYWTKGLVHTDRLNDKSINYVCKYHVLRGDHPHGTEKPFSLSSKGLGLEYVRSHGEWHAAHPYVRDFIWVDGRKKPLPRYMKEKIFNKRILKGLAAINREKSMLSKIKNAPGEYEKNYFVNKFNDTNYKNINFKKKSERGGSL